MRSTLGLPGSPDGILSRRLFRLVGMHEYSVAKWRKRFLQYRLDRLVEDPPFCHPRIYGHDERMKMAVAPTAERTPGDTVLALTYKELAGHLGRPRLSMPLLLNCGEA